jgi:hypothetical protein
MQVPGHISIPVPGTKSTSIEVQESPKNRVSPRENAVFLCAEHQRRPLQAGVFASILSSMDPNRQVGDVQDAAARISN